jgi:VanZ family protein
MRSRPPVARWTAVVVGTVVLFVASLVPSPLERHPEWKYVGPDKLLHLVGHAGYGAVLADALAAGRCSGSQAAVLAVCLSTAHSLVTGRFQERVPGRVFELADVVAGLVGAVLGVLGWRLVVGTSTARSR